MLKVSGKAVYKGIVIGPVLVFRKSKGQRLRMRMPKFPVSERRESRRRRSFRGYTTRR